MAVTEKLPIHAKAVTAYRTYGKRANLKNHDEWYVEGNISANANITVGDRGEIKGNISADNVIVGGKVMGIVAAKEKLVLEANASLQGDISTKILVIASGAKFDGNSKMVPAQGGSYTASEKDTQHQHDKKN